MTSILPPPKTIFIDANGTPLIGGFVHTYVPNTTTPKTTWQDAGQSVSNTNPIVLDGGGGAFIYGSGQYTFTVNDINGNLIWTGLTNSPLTTADLLDVTVPAPAGRLSLSASLAIQTADITAATTIYFLPYNGQPAAPIYNGTQFSQVNCTGVTLSLNATSHPASKVFDIYVSLQGSTPTLSAMYWGSNTSRSASVGGLTGTGNATITQVSGIWVNNAALSAADSFNGVTGVAVPQYRGTYLGTFYTTANGQTGMAIRPARALGGANNILGLYNAYNRVRITALCQDSTASWTYASATVRPVNNSTSNRISWVDGLQQSEVRGSYSTTTTATDVTDQAATVGVAFNATNQLGIGIINQSAFTGNVHFGQQIIGYDITYPLLGFNYCQALEQSTTAGMSFAGNGFSGLELTYDA